MNQLEVESEIDQKHCITNVNHLKKYFPKECWIIVGISNTSSRVTELLLIEHYANILKTMVRCQMNIHNDKLYLLHAIPCDPRSIPMDKKAGQSVWVISNLVFSHAFIKHNTIAAALLTIESWVSGATLNQEIDDILVLIGRESIWPAGNTDTLCSYME